MRTTLAAAALVLASALPIRAQTGGISVGARILAPEEVRVGSALRVERAAGGVRVSLPVTLSHAVPPIVSVEAVPGAAACTVAPEGRTEAGWGARLRCTLPPGGAPPAPVRLLLTPRT